MGYVDMPFTKLDTQVYIKVRDKLLTAKVVKMPFEYKLKIQSVLNENKITRTCLHLHTCLSPSLLHLYDVSSSIVVIIDVLRATSTIATALYNGAKSIIPVDSVAECIKLGKQMDVITAGERDGKIAEGLKIWQYSFAIYSKFIKGKTLVLLQPMAPAFTYGLGGRCTGNYHRFILQSFSSMRLFNCAKQNVILACAAWKDRINIEDTLFAGAVIKPYKRIIFILIVMHQKLQKRYIMRQKMICLDL